MVSISVSSPSILSMSSPLAALSKDSSEKEQDAAEALCTLSQKHRSKRKQEESECTASARVIKKAKFLNKGNYTTPEKLYAKLLTSKTAAQLLNRVQLSQKQQGFPNVSIQFITNKQDQWYGQCEGPSGIVSIRADLKDDEKLSIFVFELLNLLKSPRFEAFELPVSRGEGTAILYAVSVEAIEYESVLEYPKIIKKCIEEDGWNPSIYTDGILLKFASFDEYLKIQVEEGHTQRYVDRFQSALNMARRHLASA